MADITNLSKFLGDIADAIRTKKDTTDLIPAENFDTEILSISSSDIEGVKLFSSIEEMNADVDAKVGDLATVCGKSIYPINKTSIFNNIVVRDSFKLSRPIGGMLQASFMCTDSIYQSLYSMSIMAYDTGIRINGKVNSVQFSIQYSSTDGLTFKLSSSNYPGSLDKYLKFFDRYYEWDDIISEIILTEMNDYKGLYEYKQDEGYLPIVSQISLKNSFDIKPGLIAIGADGEVVGTDDFYENIELSTLVSKNTDTKKYEKGIFVESTHDKLTGIVDKNVTTIEDFKNLVIFKKGLPYYYEEFDDTNGTPNVTYVFSNYHVRISGDVANLCAYMSIYDVNNNLVYEETVSIPKLDKSYNR